MKRRDLCGLSLAGILGLPGCTSDRKPPCDRYRSATPDRARSGTDEPASNPCEGVQPPADLKIRNEQNDPVTLDVTVTYEASDCEEVVHESSYEVRTERAILRFFQEFLRRGEDLPGSYHLEAEVGFWDQREEISTSLPHVRTLEITISGGLYRVDVSQAHADVPREVRKQYAECCWEG